MAKPRRDPADLPRSVAFDVLRRVEVDDAYANLLLPSALRTAGLGGRDAGFVTELVAGTLRRQGTYDVILQACVDRPLAKLDRPVLVALRLGAHQLLSMRVASHAAVSTTVSLVRAQIGHGPSGLVNAVLRKVGAADLGGWVTRLSPADERGRLALAHSHPDWVVDALGESLKAVGARDQLEALLAADNEPPRVTLVARPGFATLEELAEAGATPTGASAYAAVLGSGDPGQIPAVVQGRAAVQDEGSQMVATALAQAPIDGSDARWLDVCAGPGGKSALLAAHAVDRSALLLAAELQPHRAGLVRRGTRAVQTGLAGVIAADGTRPAWRPATFDRVLLDVPCTGLGALRRRPEARWRRTPELVAELVDLQARLLDTAVDAVRVGGVVGYATCSPVLAETRGIVERVLADRNDVVLEDSRGLFATNAHDGPLIDGRPGSVQLWPHRHDTDAMFFALLRRI